MFSLPFLSDFAVVSGIVVGIMSLICFVACSILLFKKIRSFLFMNNYSVSDGIRELRTSYNNVRKSERERRFDKTLLGKMRKDWIVRNKNDNTNPYFARDWRGKPADLGGYLRNYWRERNYRRRK